ncbi:sensor histidine kinase [Aquibium oceanicum]|uniref:Blue-light-activated histidine kinase n=1 Tax=Aquibium oceanicum TaxID=1670800 RepID=A0A1L3SQZ3_9HYPH|nr:HWE histidine kinase domain-containing protein [Aquibium oceanicum]APH71745.1 histidine kinase [Aquibium oceanicum]
MSGPDTHTDLAELRRRLAEAEDTLRAIREGEVDALVVRGSASEEVFTLEGDTASYRSFMEAMEPGAAALDGSGRVLYLNATLRDLLDVDGEKEAGKPFVDLLDPAARGTVETLLGEPSNGRRSGTIQIPARGGDLHFLVSVVPLKIGTINGYAVTFAEVTERVRAEAAEQSERAARAVIASANEAVIVCDREGVITHANAAAAALSDRDLVGREFAEAVPLSFPGATGLVQADDIVAMAIVGTAVQGIEAIAPNALQVKDYLVSAAPLRVVGERVSGCVVTLVDLTHRKAAEKHQMLLMRELDHRVKNTLALVQSISSRTLMNEDTLEGFQKAFNGRLQALAATHTLLSENSWTDMTVHDIVVAELAPFVPGDSPRLSLHDLDEPISPRAAIALGLIVHELATNAVKYGALTGQSGVVEVTRVALPVDGRSSLEIEWRERGGPQVTPPQRQGFGRTLITRSMQYSKDGGAEISFEPEGIVCRISIPGEDVAGKSA